MPNPILPGQYVTWSVNDKTHTGRVIQLLDATVNKAADGSDPDQGARVKLIQDGAISPEVQILRTGDLSPFVETTAEVVKTVSPEKLQALLDGLTEHERNLMATAYFTATGPKLPTTIIGQEGARTPLDGIDQALGGMAQRA